MRALVTGGAGFIGSHITERLLKEGHSVVVLDNFYSGKEQNLSFVNNYSLSANRYTLIRGDIRSYDTCLSACQGIDVVFHQAALRSVPQSMKNPHDYNDVNINGTLNMLKAAKESKVKRFVFASSSSVYGDTDKFPQKEDQYPLLISPYALSKLTGEFYCRIFSQNYGLETVALRYFNVFGPRQALDDEYAVVIPKFISCILNDENPPIFGDGKQSRDFAYIDNVVGANFLTVKATGVAGQVFNVAGGKEQTIIELVADLNEIIGKSIKPKFLPKRTGDVYRTLADLSKAEKLLGYKPKVSFRKGLEQTVKYFQVRTSLTSKMSRI